MRLYKSEVDTGNLKNSLTHSVDEDELSVTIGTPNRYAVYVEMGTGLYVDGGYMYKILTGQRNAPKVVEAIQEILGIQMQC